LDHGGNILSRWQLPEARPLILGGASIANLDEDKPLEFVIGAEERIYAYNSDGTPLGGGWPVQRMTWRYLFGVGSGKVVGYEQVPLIVELSGDDRPDVLFLTPYDGLDAVDWKGQPLKSFPKLLPGILD
jgi:hypothetical protein